MSHRNVEPPPGLPPSESLIRAQPKLGILSLDTAFPRILGDVGNPASYPFPAEVRIVPGADSPLVVQDGDLSPDLLQRFIKAAVSLERDGASAIISTCGFLVTAQAAISRSVAVPVMLSSLLLHHRIQKDHPGKVGILTASSAALGHRSLAAANIAPDAVCLRGLDHIPLFRETFLATRSQQRQSFDRDAMEAKIVEAAKDLKAQNPKMEALLLECGNLPPYANAIQQATGLPTYHLVDAAIEIIATTPVSASTQLSAGTPRIDAG